MGDKGRNSQQQEITLFEDFYDNNVEWWKESTANLTIIPIGRCKGKGYNIIFDEEAKLGLPSSNAIITGMPGSGKSNLLHTMIIGSCINYSPNELRLVLIDLKSSEFNQYVDEKLPHADFIANKATPEVCIHLLKIICDKIKERQHLFIDKKVINYECYRKENPNERLPRYMIVIDEYGLLFRDGESRNLAYNYISFIVNRGRKLGFIIILSSQSVLLPADLMAVMRHRIVMRSSVTTARDVLWFDDERAPHLNIGQAIVCHETTDLIQCYFLPNSYSDKTANSNKLRFDYLRLINERWSKETQAIFEHNLYVFDRNKPAILSNNKQYRSLTVNDNTEVFFSPGEKFLVDGSDFMCKFIRAKNENLLVIGGKIDVSVRTTHGCLMSMLPQFDPKQIEIDIVNLLDFSHANLREKIESTANLIKARYKKTTYTKLNGGVNALLDDVIKDIEQRTDKLGKGEYLAPRFLIIFQTENNQDFWEINTEGRSTKSFATNRLVQLLKTGSDVGVHCLLHFNNTDGYFNIFDEDDKSYFNHRILLQMSEKDSKIFLDSYIQKDAAQLVDNEASEENKYNMALYKNMYDTVHVKIKPYEFMDIK